ncbi:hypothetical protein [Pseudomonas umsongensis]|uniref:hypothetical protein n=1 Tax=Pseudomonas umsongensis TaxID=198618 RepID=UPI003ECFDA46
MPMTNTAVFAQTPKTNKVTLTAAVAVNTAGSTLITAGANGAVVTSVRFSPNGTVTASGVNLNRAGAPIRSETLTAYTLSATAKLPQVAFDVSRDYPITLGANETLDVSLLVAQAAGVTVFAEWMDY